MQFVLSGFRQTLGERVYTFEGIAEDRSRSNFTVSADLALTRQYGIRLQELPLLCRAVLEHGHDGSEARTFSYSEQAMQQYASAAAAAKDETAKRRKPPRRPSNAEPLGSAWRLGPRI